MSSTCPTGRRSPSTDSEDGPAGRTVGLLVRDLDAAVAELRAAGVPTDDDVSGNERERYIHFWAPDGQLYELIERRA